MFMATKNLGVMDQAILNAIAELHKEHDLISARKIASYINVSDKTVYRSLQRLRAAGMVQRGCGAPKKGGYRYDVI